MSDKEKKIFKIINPIIVILLLVAIIGSIYRMCECYDATHEDGTTHGLKLMSTDVTITKMDLNYFNIMIVCTLSITGIALIYKKKKVPIIVFVLIIILNTFLPISVRNDYSLGGFSSNEYYAIGSSMFLEKKLTPDEYYKYEKIISENRVLFLFGVRINPNK